MAIAYGFWPTASPHYYRNDDSWRFDLRAPRATTRLLIAASAAVALSAGLAGPLDSTPSLTDDADFIARLKALDNGLADVGCLNLPEAFLQHIADWDVRGSYRTAMRRVAPDAPGQPPAPVPAPNGVPPASDVIVKDVQLPQSLLDQWMHYGVSVPSIAGFRAPIGDQDASNPWPFDLLPRGNDAKAYRDAATFVARHLARDGLVRTVLRLMHESTLGWSRGEALDISRFRAVGVPVDLVECFTVDDQPLGSALK